MINRMQFLADLQTLLRRLEADLLERSEEMAPVEEVLRLKCCSNEMPKRLRAV